MVCREAPRRAGRSANLTRQKSPTLFLEQSGQRQLSHHVGYDLGERAKLQFQGQPRHWTLPDLVSAERIRMAFCIATDDPRLKEK